VQNLPKSESLYKVQNLQLQSWTTQKSWDCQSADLNNKTCSGRKTNLPTQARYRPNTDLPRQARRWNPGNQQTDNSTERWIWIDSWPSHQLPTPRMRVAQAQAREARAVQLPRRPRRTTAMSGLIYLAHDLGYLQLCKYSRGGVT
jgi:hypothetical protein